jgi:hypothetical protein
MAKHLLVLTGEIIFADRPADLLDHRDRLARREQCLAAPPLEAARPQQAVAWNGEI